MAADCRDEHAAVVQQVLATSYRAMHYAYREREAIFARTMADRADWEQATRRQRRLAVAADAELRRRHPGQRFALLRSAEPDPATQAERDELTMTAGEETKEVGRVARPTVPKILLPFKITVKGAPAARRCCAPQTLEQ